MQKNHRVLTEKVFKWWWKTSTAPSLVKNSVELLEWFNMVIMGSDGWIEEFFLD